MTDDVSVFRSEAPPLVGTQGAAGPEQISGPPRAREGDLRQTSDSTLFAPLDEPPVLGGIDAPVNGAEVVAAEGGDAAIPLEADSPLPLIDGLPAAAAALEPEAVAERERRIRKLSPELLLRAIEIHEETEQIAAEISRVEEIFPGLGATASVAQPALVTEPTDPEPRGTTKESI